MPDRPGVDDLRHDVTSNPARRRQWRAPQWIVDVSKPEPCSTDPEEDALRRQSLVLMALAITPLATMWVITYALLGLYLSALIPLVYQVMTIGGLLRLARSGGFARFRTLQLYLMLALPVLLQLSLGGFGSSSGVMLWSLAAPLGALVFARRPAPWFFGYIALTVGLGLVDPLLTPAEIPQPINLAFFVLNIGAVSAVVYALVRHFTRGLAAERQKSELLLLNVLPSSVARRLKSGERPIADRFEEAGILFADIVGFTPISERLEPDELVVFLDDLFTRFDELAERRGLEKIKTVGDAYMAVAGVPELGTGDLDSLAEAALDMQSLVRGMRFPNGEPLLIRIGIDVGPLVGGVIGTRKFAYDLWGDSVNSASRMESSGIPGEIQVSERARHRLAERYRFRPRGHIEVKGKGKVSTYLLISKIETVGETPHQG